MGNCRGERAICSREWLTAPPYVLLPQQEVTELLKLVILNIFPAKRKWMRQKAGWHKAKAPGKQPDDHDL
jgi:hypothetical protein